MHKRANRAGDLAEGRIANRLHRRYGINSRYLDFSQRFFADDHIRGRQGSDLGFGLQRTMRIFGVAGATMPPPKAFISLSSSINEFARRLVVSLAPSPPTRPRITIARMPSRRVLASTHLPATGNTASSWD